MILYAKDKGILVSNSAMTAYGLNFKITMQFCTFDPFENTETATGKNGSWRFVDMLKLVALKNPLGGINPGTVVRQ